MSARPFSIAVESIGTGIRRSLVDHGHPLYTATAFLSATLLFFALPLAARLVLPRFDGALSVWSGAFTLFAAALAAGFAVGRIAGTRATAWTQAAAPLTLLAAGLIPLPYLFGAFAVDAAGWAGSPTAAAWTAGSLALPAVALGALLPLLRRWSAPERSGVETVSHPPLVAWLLGGGVVLAAYPTLIEPNIALRGQLALWSGLYALQLVTLVLCLAARLHRDVQRSETEAARPDTGAVDLPRRLQWLLAGALPAGLLIGLTEQLSVRIAASAPVWTVPLLLYLASFAFGAGRVWPVVRDSALWAQTVLAITVVLTFWTAIPLSLEAGLHLALFFATALVCQRLLSGAVASPAMPGWFAAGTLVGAAGATILWPTGSGPGGAYIAFLLTALLLRPWRNGWRASRTLNVACLAAFAMLASLMAISLDGGPAAVTPLGLVLFCAAGICFMLTARTHPIRFFTAAAISLLATANLARMDVGTVVGPRNGGVHPIALSGWLPPMSLSRPASTQGFGTTDDIRWVIGRLRNDRAVGAVAAIAAPPYPSACDAAPDEAWTLFPVGAATPRRDELAECARHVAIIDGDARAALAKAPRGGFDVIVLDVSGSRALPVHLFTTEAFLLYRSRLSQQGVILVNTDRRSVQLVFAVEAGAVSAGMRAKLRRPRPANDGYRAPSPVTGWIAVARSQDDLALFDDDWTPLAPVLRRKPWTDDYANVLGDARW